MELIGDVSSIIYKNEENNYTIATVVVEQISETPLELGYNILGLETTVVGYLPFIDKGEKVKFVGKFVVHPDYGDQFKVDSFEKIMPKTLDALEKYLSNGMIKGIGPSIAKKIVKQFGDDTINVIKNEQCQKNQATYINTNYFCRFRIDGFSILYWGSTFS